MEISLIIPCYNEENRLPGFLEEAVTFLKNSGLKHEILVVDDGSADRTVEIAQRLLGNKGVLRHSVNLGKGAAVKSGMLAASGKFRLFADADGATPISEISRLLPFLNSGNDIAIASRVLKTPVIISPEWEKRRVEDTSEKVKRIANPIRIGVGRIHTAIAKILLGFPFQDTQCGFKLFTAESARILFSRLSQPRYSFDLDILCLARDLGYSVAEVPVNWRHVPESKVSVLRDGMKMFKDLWALRQKYPRTMNSNLVSNMNRSLQNQPIN